MMKSSNENYRHAASAAAHDIDNNHNKQMYSNNASSSIGKERSSASSSGYTLAPRTFSSVPSRVIANANAKLSQSELDRHIGHSLRMRSKQQRQNTTTTRQHHLPQQQQQQQNDPCTTIKDRQTMPSSSAAEEDRTVCFMMEMDTDVIDNDDNDDEHADYSNLLEQQQQQSKDNIANPSSSPAITHSADVAVPDENGVDKNGLAEHNEGVDVDSTKVDDEWLLLQILEYKCQCQLLEEEMLQLKLKKQHEQRQRRLLRRQRRQQRERLKKIKLIPPVDDDRTIIGECDDDDEEQKRRRREMKRERRRQRRLQREQEEEEVAANDEKHQRQQQHPPPPIMLRHKPHHCNGAIDNETHQQHVATSVVETITATKTADDDDDDDDENEPNAVDVAADGEMMTEDEDDLDLIVDEIQQELLQRLHITKEENAQAQGGAVMPDDMACRRVNEERKDIPSTNYDGFDLKFPFRRALMDASTNNNETITSKLNALTTPKLKASTTLKLNNCLTTPMVNSATPTTPKMNSSTATTPQTSTINSTTTPTTCSTTASTPASSTTKPQFKLASFVGGLQPCRFEFSPSKRQQQRGQCSSVTKSNATIETVTTSSSMDITPGDDDNGDNDVGMLSSPTPKKKALPFLSSSSPFQLVSEVRQYCLEMSPPPIKRNNQQTPKTHSQDHPCLSSVSSITKKSKEEEKNDNTTAVKPEAILVAHESVSEMRQRLDRERKHVELRHKMDILAAKSPSFRTIASRRHLFGSSAAATQEDQKLQQSSFSLLSPSLQGRLHQTLSVEDDENSNDNNKKRPPFFLRGGNNSNHKSNSTTSHFYQEHSSSRSRAA